MGKEFLPQVLRLSDHCVLVSLVITDYLTDCYDNAEGDNASNYVLLSLLPSF